jgi:oligopeptidase B
MFEEMKGRIKEDDASVPAPDGPFEYYSRFNIGGQHPIFARRPKGQADGEEILLDCDALAKGKAYSQVSAADHSPDHKLFAYAEDAQGSEVHHIYVKDLATGEILKEPVESSTGDFAWSPDSLAVLDPPRRQRPLRQDLPPPGARRAEGRRAGL